ncbi:C2H2-type domain-containing protein [Fusarium keratoplasticum]|uniref:C2H2-type domain-containing protein n=1 Tax=Fusarium keratoplasticum TaxID=1328300 RepID=A0ACC0QT82_9HYPO|nr:C2H2-type domain-containing protein [Fusarium keratoplasticum]KAI8666516.1 C2H2-type domain-containing protein [Fusarium keratoplasticum]KAI8668214.1 C2H2-type domain-containing protein [Fusarium keratoplasticum]
MFLVPTQQPHTFVDHRASLHSSPSTNNHYHSKLGSEVTVDALLSSPISMERSAPEYSQSGLPSPYPSNFGDTNSEGSTADHASAAQYPVKQETNYSTSGTPTSEYGVYPQSARSGSFPDHIQRSYHPASTPSSGGMAQQQNSPSMPQQDGRNHQAHPVKSDNDVPIDPSIAAPSPTYASYGQQSPYAPAPDMTHSYSHPSSGMYAQPRPDWTGYGHHGGAPLTPGHPVYAQNPASAPPPARPNQVYSFVPIPGAQQHKRPRRRYEEIERMYKCGWNGCEKAYGTLNHLNAHVTMQSHGQKRTPEEFKEIRKEWKQRKKEEEAARKAEEERQRVAAAASVQNGGPDPQGPDGTPTSTYPGSRPVQLPPIGYQPAQYPPPPTASVPQQPLPDYNNHMYSNYQPHSPYAQPSQGISYQSNGGQPPSH